MFFAALMRLIKCGLSVFVSVFLAACNVLYDVENRFRSEIRNSVAVRGRSEHAENLLADDNYTDNRTKVSKRRLQSIGV